MAKGKAALDGATVHIDGAVYTVRGVSGKTATLDGPKNAKGQRNSVTVNAADLAAWDDVAGAKGAKKATYYLPGRLAASAKE